jgi:Ca2+-transporting ATPase
VQNAPNEPSPWHALSAEAAAERLGRGHAARVAQTAAFTGIILLEKMNVFNFRALREPLWTVGFFSNPWVLLAWTLTVGLQVCAVYTPFLQRALHTVPLSWGDWGLMLAVALPVFLAAEVFKWFSCRSLRKDNT